MCCSSHVLQVPVTTRLQQFPDQSLRASGAQIMCACCLHILPNIYTSIGAHINTAKHKGNLATFNSKNKQDRDLMVSLGEYFRVNPNEAMSTLSPNDHLARFRIVETFMAAGVAVSKLNTHDAHSATGTGERRSRPALRADTGHWSASQRLALAGTDALQCRP